MSIAFVQASHNQEVFSTSQGMKLAFPAAVGVGNALVTVVVGKKNPNPYTAGTTTTEGTQDMNTNTPAPVFANQAGVVTNWSVSSTFKSIDAKTITGTLFTDESDPDLNADYPAIYVAKKTTGVLADESILVKSAYIGPQASPSQDANGAAGVSIFNGGVNAVALEFSGIVTGTATEQHRVTTANPAVSGAGTLAASSGDVMIAAGYMKNANTFAASSGWTVVYMDKCVTGQDHFVVAYKIVSGADQGSFSNPLGYEMAVTTVKIAA